MVLSRYRNIFLVDMDVQFVGIAVVALAAFAFIDNANEVDPTRNEHTMFFKICVVVIAMGSLLTIVGFIGCCGAAFENQCLLGTVNKPTNDIFHAQFIPNNHITLQFVFLMIAALALDVAAAIVVDNDSETIISETKFIVENIFKKLKENKDKADKFQTVFSCCGFESVKDWIDANIMIPNSCCKNETESCHAKFSVALKTILGPFKEVDLSYLTSCITSAINQCLTLFFRTAFQR